jgi:hypothetical protein
MKLQIGLWAQNLNGTQRVFQNKKWWTLKFLTGNTISTTFYVNVSTDPLKTFTFALFSPQIPPKTTKIR